MEIATGIGRATSNAFAEAGVAKLILLARSQDPMTKAKREIEASFPQTEVLTYSASVTDTERVAKVVKEVSYNRVAIT